MKRKWQFMLAEGHKAIFASPEVASFVRQTIDRRQCDMIEEDEHDEAFVDYPGMCLSDRQLWEGDVDGLHVVIPVTDFSLFLNEMRTHLYNNDHNGDNDGTRQYRSIYGWRQVIALTQQQYVTLFELMSAQLADVEVRAQQDNQRFMQGINRVNQDLKEAGVAVVVEPRRMSITKGPDYPIGGQWH